MREEGEKAGERKRKRVEGGEGRRGEGGKNLEKNRGEGRGKECEFIDGFFW